MKDYNNIYAKLYMKTYSFVKMSLQHNGFVSIGPMHSIQCADIY